MKDTTYRNYLLSILLVILAFNYVDRTALGLVLQQIKLELHLTDTQLGLLSGIAFALFYSVMGIPIARWADRGNRATIITVTTALWSAAVALCGAAGSFLQLLSIRIGVAVGEAGCIPPAHSLIADYFDRTERPRAVARYMLGVPLSLVLGYFVAGWLNQFYGWRSMFVVLGLPGLALAVLAWFTIAEPRVARSRVAEGEDRASGTRGGIEPGAAAATRASSAARIPLMEVVVTLGANSTFRHLLLCFAVLKLFGVGILQWQPAFFVRSYGMQTGELGTWFAVIYGIGGLLGTYLGGELASRRAANNERLQLAAMAIACTFFGLASVFIYVSPNRYIAFLMMGLGAIGGVAVNGPLFATIQTLVPGRMRAMAIASIYLFANLIGAGLGPLAAGAISDGLRPFFGEESLRYALLALSPGYFWAGWHLWRASKTVMADVKRVESQSSTPMHPEASGSLGAFEGSRVEARPAE